MLQAVAVLPWHQRVGRHGDPVLTNSIDFEGNQSGPAYYLLPAKQFSKIKERLAAPGKDNAFRKYWH